MIKAGGRAINPEYNDTHWMNDKIYEDVALRCWNAMQALASPSPAPSWLERDVARAFKQVKQWENPSPAPGVSSQAGEELHEALDNSQSLLAMIYQLNTKGSVAEYDWENEGLSDLITKQIEENRAALSRADRGK